MKELDLREVTKSKWEAPVLVTFSASTLTQAGTGVTSSETTPTQVGATYQPS